MQIRKNDLVLVIAGKYRDKQGRVLKVFPDVERVIVEGVNIIKRHTKPNRKNAQGGILQKEAPIHVSNVMLIDPKANKATRTGSKHVIDVTTGKRKRMRISKVSQEMF
jgi:large subunit ribosomal protein L24